MYKLPIFGDNIRKIKKYKINIKKLRKGVDLCGGVTYTNTSQQRKDAKDNKAKP